MIQKTPMYNDICNIMDTCNSTEIKIKAENTSMGKRLFIECEGITHEFETYHIDEEINKFNKIVMVTPHPINPEKFIKLLQASKLKNTVPSYEKLKRLGVKYCANNLFLNEKGDERKMNKFYNVDDINFVYTLSVIHSITELDNGKFDIYGFKK